jgi:hemerythrin-like metal-binding protein
MLLLCPLFTGVRSEEVLNSIAASLQMRSLKRGQAAPSEQRPELFLLIEGEMDLVVGEQLIESFGPGGFWGEERIVSNAPSLGTARAVSACAYAVIPAEALADIPIVKWELMETFERRLRSFRAGFRFEWSESFRVDVRELDDQHRTLFSLINALSHRIEKTGNIAGHDEQKREVLEHTKKHFQTEEFLMESNGYAQVQTQKQEHAALLDRLERFVDADERRVRPRTETMIDYLKDWLIRHTLMEDLKYKEFFAQKGVR